MNPAHVLIAMSAFKGTLSARQACEAVRLGMSRAWPEAAFVLLPLADGGAGTMDALTAGKPAERRFTRVTGPLGDPVVAEWAVIEDGRTAVLEMAQASGLSLVPAAKRNPIEATSFGTGELIAAALDSGCRRVLLGVGDSATVDGGMGASQALGAALFTAKNDLMEQPFRGGDLERLSRIRDTPLKERLSGVSIEVLCDVESPVLGPKGSAAVYGPQKGATPAMVAQLERGLANLCHVLAAATGRQVGLEPGGGAAGGIAATAMALWSATIVSGAETVLKSLDFQKHLAAADLVVTGEGRMDEQTLAGKGPGRVALAARRRGVPCVALVGLPPPDEEVPRGLGLAAWRALAGEGTPPPSAEQAASDLEEAARELTRPLAATDR